MRSMTAFSHLNKSTETFSVNIAIKSLNHRYLDIDVCVDENYAFLEHPIRKRIRDRISRGKIYVRIDLGVFKSGDYEVVLHKNVLKKLMDKLQNFERENSFFEERVNAGNLIPVSDVVTVESRSNSMEEEERKTVKDVFEDCLDELIKMKEKEGQALAEDLRERFDFIEQKLVRIEEETEGMLEIYAGKLRNRTEKILEENNYEVEAEKIIEEAALRADRSDVSEEIVRMKSHLQQAQDLFDSEGTTKGKKLDFILQEMQREINTIGSKAKHVPLSEPVIELKSELEKLREQVRNIE